MTSKISMAREIAYDAFVDIMEKYKTPEEAVENALKNQDKKLSRLDRNLVKEILYGGLRWYSKIYWIVQNTSQRDLVKTTPQIRSALVLGAYQIFYMDRIPDRAIVNDSVEYIRNRGQAGAVSFVNGILRAISRRAEYFAKPDKDSKPAEYLALQYAHPKWMIDRWLTRFNFERLKDLLSSNNEVPPFSVRINSLKIPYSEVQKLRSKFLKEEKVQSDKRPLRSSLVLRGTPRFDSESLLSQGFYSVQDESSQLIGLLVDPQPGELVYDLCAGPGGKLSHICELAKGEAEVVGFEKSPGQYQKALDNLKRLGVEGYTLNQGNFLKVENLALADKILLDAPCSGLGVLRRHPEGKWNKKPDIIKNMAGVQREYLKAAWNLLKEGGTLVYSVCSYETEELDEHLAWILREYQGKIEVISPVRKLPDYFKRFVTRDNLLSIFSGNKDGMDGFGAFVIRKVK